MRKNPKSKIQNPTRERSERSSPHRRAKFYVFLLSALILSALVLPADTYAQGTANPLPPAPTAVPTRTLQTQLEPSTNPNSSAFKIAVCDGPTLPSTVTKPDGYVACDFNAVMLLVQHLINIMMVLGVLVAIVMFSYAGLLFISGQKPKIDKARSIFPKVFLGFIIMLSAWFIVYQLLSWLTSNPGFKTLLGSP